MIVNYTHCIHCDKYIKKGDLDTTTLIAVYEVVVNEDFDYIENLFPTKEDFKEFIEKYKGAANE